MPSTEYNDDFKANDPNSEKLKSAFNQVCDIRKFEIGLYWTRATYFWTLIAVAFAGYFAIFSAEAFPHQHLLSLIVGSVGFVLTFAWFLANRGSKYWQENWENHLDLLEDNVTGPLYKTVLQRPLHTSLTERFVTGPLSVSVSKINQWIGIYVIGIWLILIGLSSLKTLSFIWKPLPTWLIDWKLSLIVSVNLIIIGGAILSCGLMLWQGKTHKGSHDPVHSKRTTRISGRAPSQP